jgi:hypothetical protein
VTVAWITRSRVAGSPLRPPLRVDGDALMSARSFGLLMPSTLDAPGHHSLVFVVVANAPSNAKKPGSTAGSETIVKAHQKCLSLRERLPHSSARESSAIARGSCPLWSWTWSPCRGRRSVPPTVQAQMGATELSVPTRRAGMVSDCGCVRFLARSPG